MIIDTQQFLNNPNKYAGAVIISAAAYEEYKKNLSIQRGLADRAAGRMHTQKEVFGQIFTELEEQLANEKV